MSTAISTDLLWVGGTNVPGLGFRDDNPGGDLGWVIGANDRGGGGNGDNALCIISFENGASVDDTWRPVEDSSGGTEVATFGQTGHVGIGNINPGYELTIAGTLYASGSSLEYKKNIDDYIHDISNLLKLRPVKYQYKEKYKKFGKKLSSGYQIGLIAEETDKIYPELGVKLQDNEGSKNVDYEKLSILLLQGIKNLNDRVNKLKEV